MGLVLSAIVVCVGLAEVLDCWHHFILHLVQPQYNPLPYRLNSKTDIRNETELTLLSESRITSNIDICWPKDISPNDDLHVIRKRTHSESDRNVSHEVENSTFRIAINEVECETFSGPSRSNFNKTSPQITVNDLDPYEQLRVVSPLLRTELSPDHLSLDVIVESDSSSELDEPSQIENLAYKKKIEESLKIISKIDDSAEEANEISRITKQYSNNSNIEQPQRPTCPSSLSKENITDTNDPPPNELEPTPLPTFTENILSSGVQQVPCRYSDRTSLPNIVISSFSTKVVNNDQIIEVVKPSTRLEEIEQDKIANITSALCTSANVQSVESILDEGLDPIPEFPEIRLHESSPVPTPDNSDSSLDTSDASWLAKGKTSDRPLIIRLPQFKELNSESKKSHKNEESIKDIYYDAEDFQFSDASIPTTSNIQSFGEQLTDSSIGLGSKLAIKLEKEEIECVVEIAEVPVIDKEVVSFGECAPNSGRLHSLQRDTNSSSSSLSGIPQLPEDVKDYSTRTSLPTDNGFDAEHSTSTDYELSHNADLSSLEQVYSIEKSTSLLVEQNRNIDSDICGKHLDDLTRIGDISPKPSDNVCKMVVSSTDVPSLEGDDAGNKDVLNKTRAVTINYSSIKATESKTTDSISSTSCLSDEHLITGVSNLEVIKTKETKKEEICANENETKFFKTGISTEKELLKELSDFPSNEIPVNQSKNIKIPLTDSSVNKEVQQDSDGIVDPNYKTDILSGDFSKDQNPVEMRETSGIIKNEKKSQEEGKSVTAASGNDPNNANVSKSQKETNTNQVPNSPKGAVPKAKLKRKPKEESVRESSKSSAENETSNTTADSQKRKSSVERENVHPAPSTSSNSGGPSTSQLKEDDPERKASWLIFSGEYTKAMNKDWHSGHFCCWQCDESLTGQRYVLRDEHPYCIKCYETVFANGCEECNKTIGIDSKDLSYKDKHWHEACFLCNKCRVSLVDKQFGSKLDKIFCGNCYDAQFASRCDGCGNIFKAGTKKMEYKTRQWHEPCFSCCVCKSPIGTKSFIPREQEIYCATCYEEKFATRCVKCNKIITSGGVTYKNEPWHRECFTCTNCSTSLAGQRFTSRDEKPYCAECFGELFAKRCTSCCKPITGIGGTRFISFEDRHWHNDCFICASCKTSLVGRGFITDADDIICPECAKQKLM